MAVDAFQLACAPANLDPSNQIRGGARVADWARLLSECWVKPVAGSNPVLPATYKIRSVIERLLFLI